MDAQINMYAQMLLTAFTSSNNQQRKEAEANLINNSLQHANSLEVLAAIVEQGNNDFIKEQAAVYIGVVIKRYATQPCPYGTAMQKSHAETCVNLLKSNIPTKLKKHISVALTSLINFASKGFGDSETRKALQNYCSVLFEQFPEAGLFVCQALIGALDLNSLQGESLDWLKLYMFRGQEIVKALQNSPIDQMPQHLSMMQVWSDISLELCRKASKTKESREVVLILQNLLIGDDNFSTSLINILIFQVTHKVPTIMSSTGDANIDSIINEAKAKSLQSYNLILTHLINERTKSEIKRSPFYIKLSQLLPTLIVCLLSLASAPNFDLDLVLNQPHLSSMITQMMKTITICGGQQEYYQLLTEAKSTIIIDVVFPFISTSKAERQMMVNEPEEFVNLALDTIDKQISEIPKTAAAQLLEAFCDHIDGSTSLVTQLCLIIIQHAIHQLSPPSDQQPPEHFSIIKDVETRYFFTKLSPINRVDTALTCLTVMSYLLSRRQDLISLMEAMLLNNYVFFSDPQQDPLVTSRLCLFLGYYCDNVFKTQTSGNLVDFVKVLLNQLNLNNNQPWRFAVLYQAIDALKNIFEDEELIPKVKDLLPSMFPVLCAALSQSTYDPHFEMITTQLKLYANIIQGDLNLLNAVIDVLVNRIIVEQQKVNNGQSDVQVWINKCWNILRTLPEIDGYIPQNLQLIESHLLKLYALLETPEKVDFDEDVVLMVSAMIDKSQIITESQLKLLFLVPKVHAKQKNRLGQLFEMLNNYIIYERTGNPDVQRLILSMAQQSMNGKGETANEADEGEGVLILQLCIQKWGESIHIDLLRQVFQATILKASQDIQQQFLQSRLMGVFLSAFLYDFNRTRQLLHELGFLDQIVKQLTESSHLCEPGYDIKLYIFSMCQLIQQSPKDFSVQLIDQMGTLLYKQQQFESKRIKKRDDDDDDDDYNSIEDEESDELFNEEKQEAEISLESFKSDLKKRDEYQAFRQLINFYRNNYPDVLQQLKQMSTPEKLQFLQNILAFERIAFNDGELGVPRKIVKPLKRKGQ